MGELRNEEHVETALARFDGQSEAGQMVQRYEQAIKETRDQGFRDETSYDCE